MTTNLAKWASNNGQIIKSGLPNDRRAKFLPSVVGFAYDLLRYKCYLGNIGWNMTSIRAWFCSAVKRVSPRRPWGSPRSVSTSGTS